MGNSAFTLPGFTATQLQALLGLGTLTPTLLSTTASINAKVVANVTLYTPSGKTAYVTGAIVRCTAATVITNGPTFGIGTNAGASNIYAQTNLAGLTSTSVAYNFAAPGIMTIAASGTPILGGVTVVATGSSQTISLDLWGYLL